MPQSRREFIESALIPAASLSLLPPGAFSMIPRSEWEPSYLRLERSGELAERAQALYKIYAECHLCPRRCGVNRLKTATGICSSTSRVKVFSSGPHMGEERPLVGRRGSGTIFFSNCNLLCEFCQNWEINHRGDGRHISDEQLGRMMVDLQERGCHNINLVTPSHCVPNIVQALRTAIRRGLRVPLAYNTSGYDSPDTVKLLDGIVDIYLPDYKYADGALAAKYSAGAEDYPEAAGAAIREMQRQVGDLIVDENGIALRGLIIRHLVLPLNIAGTDRVTRFIATEVSRSAYVNIMPQYRPAHRATRFPDISRRITTAEYRQALVWAQEAGLTRVNVDSGQ
jgi:putative pyruvate formate lyase activating enzyme